MSPRRMLRWYRLQNRHTQAQAAHIVGRGPREWKRWEAGEVPVPPPLLQLYLIVSLGKQP